MVKHFVHKTCSNVK